MATSNVSIANLALQKLGESPIVALDENSRNGRAVNACFEALRDKELRAYLWKFAKQRVILAPDSVDPAFMFNKAFVVPAGFLRVIKPARLDLDWHLENHNGQLAILTNEGDTLELRYIARITDPTLFDPLFVEMLACKLAWHLCEQLTQSNTKKAAIMEEYKELRAEARKTNAFELPQLPEPVDNWILARQRGALIDQGWNEE